MTLCVTPEPSYPEPLLGMRESTSSRKITVGAAIRAFLKISRIAFSDSPTHLLKISGPLTLMKLASLSVATARARMLTRSIWWEITTVDGIVGWVSSRYTAQVGPTFDLTSRVVDVLGEIPEEETMTDLGLVVAESFRPDDPDMPFEAVLVVLPTVGDLGEVTYDVVGFGDDTIQGLRLHVFGQPSESGEGFYLKSVESTDMCASVRGVSEPSGLCA